jgi:hypothetical protein
MTRNILFSISDSDKLSREIEEDAFQYISKLNRDYFEKKTIDEISKEIIDNLSIKLLIINENDVSQKPPVDIIIQRQSDFLSYHIQNIQGTRFHFVLPFEGDSRLLKVKPRTFYTVEPFGDVENNTINFKFEVDVNSDKDIAYSGYKDNLQLLKKWVMNVNIDANYINTNLKTFIYENVMYRKEKLNNDLDSANSFGIPIK